MKKPTLLLFLLAFSGASCAHTGTDRVPSVAKCNELRAKAGNLVKPGEKSILIAQVTQLETKEAVVIQAALNQWNALKPRQSVDEMRRVAESALGCAPARHSALNLFVATVGLQGDEGSALASFSRDWFFSEEASAQPISSLGRAVLKERWGDRNGAVAEIKDGITRDQASVARRAGLLYLSGTFFTPDDALGASWVKLAADSGDWRAQRLMALLYITGRGVPKDELAAEKYVKLAGDNPLDERRTADDAIISIQSLPPNK